MGKDKIIIKSFGFQILVVVLIRFKKINALNDQIKEVNEQL